MITENISMGFSNSSTLNHKKPLVRHTVIACAPQPCCICARALAHMRQSSAAYALQLWRIIMQQGVPHMNENTDLESGSN